jgi:cell division septum initiation protein DivIVA
MTADLDGLPFSVVRRGFDRAQVEERLGKLLAERDAAHAARQSALADLDRLSRELDVSRGETRAARTELAESRSEVERLTAHVAELSTIPSTVDGMSDRLQQMVRVAQDEVNDMRARATRGAAQILSMAQAEADELVDGSRQQRREFEAEQHQAQDELRVRLEESRTRLAQMREEADGQRARLDAELAERRSREEQSLASDIAERRDVLMTELGAQEKRQREEAQRIVDAASNEARAVLAEAAAEAERSRTQLRDHVSRGQEELEHLRALQHQIAEQLTGVRSLLDWTLPRVTAPAPTPMSATTLSATPPQAQPVFAPSTVTAMPPAAAALPPPTATLAARSFDDLSPAYADAFDDTEMNAPGDAAPDDAFDAAIATERETTDATTAQRFTGPGFPSTEDVRGDDVPEPRTAADDEPERPSPVARPERPSRLSARISSRR